MTLSLTYLCHIFSVYKMLIITVAVFFISSNCFEHEIRMWKYFVRLHRNIYALFIFCYFKSIKNIDQIPLHLRLLSGKLVELREAKINKQKWSQHEAAVGHHDACRLPFTLLVPLNLATQSVICGSEVPASPGSSQSLRSPRLPDSESALQQDLQGLCVHF